MDDELFNDYLILSRALDIAGRYVRENPPSHMPDDEAYLPMFIGRDNQDPLGRDFVKYWYSLAKKEFENGCTELSNL